MIQNDGKWDAGWWFGTFFIFPYIGNNHPNWLIFFRGVQTTNQDDSKWPSGGWSHYSVHVSGGCCHDARAVFGGFGSLLKQAVTNTRVTRIQIWIRRWISNFWIFLMVIVKFNSNTLLQFCQIYWWCVDVRCDRKIMTKLDEGRPPGNSTHWGQFGRDCSA